MEYLVSRRASVLLVEHLPRSTAAPGYRGVPGQSGASVFMVEHLPSPQLHLGIVEYLVSRRASVFMVEHLPRSTAAPGYRGVPGQSAGPSVHG